MYPILVGVPPPIETFLMGGVSDVHRKLTGKEVSFEFPVVEGSTA